MDRRVFLLGSAMFPFARRIPLSVSFRHKAWEAFCHNEPWALKPHSFAGYSDWVDKATEINNSINRRPYRSGSNIPDRLEGATNHCVTQALRKWYELSKLGFSSARLLVLTSPGPDFHAALLLHLDTGDYILDNLAKGTVLGLHHWTKLKRKPYFVTDGDRCRAIAPLAGVT